MPELILTDEEKKAASYLEWDDEALGKLVKYTAALMKDEHGQSPAFSATCAHMIVNMAREANATECTLTLTGATVKGEPIGDWEVIARRVDHQEDE